MAWKINDMDGKPMGKREFHPRPIVNGCYMTKKRRWFKILKVNEAKQTCTAIFLDDITSEVQSQLRYLPEGQRYTFDTVEGKKLAKLSYVPKLNMRIRVRDNWYRVIEVMPDKKHAIGTLVGDPHGGR